MMGPNERTYLNDPDALWMVSRGSGDVFLEKEGGVLEYLYSVEKGQVLFGMGNGVLLIIRESLEMHPLNFQEIIEEQRDLLLLDYLHKFNSFFERFKPHKIDHYLGASGRYKLAANKVCSAPFAIFPEYKHEIRWVDVKEGRLHLFDLAAYEIGVGELFPVFPTMWLEAKVPSQIETVATQEVFDHPHFSAALKHFHRTLLELLWMSLKEKENQEIDEAKGRLGIDAALLAQSVDQLGGILEKKKATAHSPFASDLFRACQIIGSRMGIIFEEPAEQDASLTVDEKVESIARASKVGVRLVRLVEGWWKQDCLSVLGFYGGQDKPVALVNRKGGDYLLINPATGEHIVVDESVASKIDTHGYYFYATLAEKKITRTRLIHFCLSKYRREMVVLFLIGLGGGILALLPPLFNELLFNKVIKVFNERLLAQIVWGLLLTTISIGIFVFVRSYAVLRLMQLIDVRLEPAFWHRVLSLPATFFRKYPVGNVIQRLFAVTDIRSLMGGNVIRVIFSGLFSILYFIAMLYYSPSLAFVGLGVLFVAALISALCLFQRVRIERLIQVVDSRLRSLVIGLIKGVSKIRVSGAEARLFAHWAKEYSEYQSLVFRSRSYNGVITSLTNSLPFFTTGLFFLVLVSMPASLTLGDFIAFLSAYVPFSMAVYDAINAFNSLVPVGPLWERARVLLEEEPESEVRKQKPGRLMGGVAFDHVTFHYEKSGAPVLQDISFHVHPGEFVAFVGPSGSGKSTLVRLLLGFDEPTSGDIYYDGKNLARLDLLEVRRQMGTVLQNGSLFSASLYENIVCGGLYTQGEVEESLRLSGFDRDLESFPMGLHTVVQSGGETLSVGQCQRLLISRALISKPKILIFDEATSALDNKTQDEVSQRLDAIEVTRIVIAHRLSTVRHANRIYVIERGRVVQSGSFLELAQVDGLFKTMLTRQLL